MVLGSIIAIFSDDIFHGVFHNTKRVMREHRSCIEEKNNGNIYDERTQYRMVKTKLLHYNFLLHNHLERVSAELGDYGSHRTDSKSANKDNSLQ